MCLTSIGKMRRLAERHLKLMKMACIEITAAMLLSIIVADGAAADDKRHFFILRRFINKPRQSLYRLMSITDDSAASRGDEKESESKASLK